MTTLAITLSMNVIEIIRIWHCLPIDYFNDEGGYQYMGIGEDHPNHNGVLIPLRILGTVWINLALSYNDTHAAFGSYWISNVISLAQGNSNTVYRFDTDKTNSSYYYRNYHK